MRIAEVAPLYESVPPKGYGGTERVVSWLTEELVRLGHDVTLFASGVSMTTARLVPCCSESLRLATGCADRTVRLWDAWRGNELVDIIWRGHDDRVRCLAFHPNGQSLASGDFLDEIVTVESFASQREK